MLICVCPTELNKLTYLHTYLLLNFSRHYDGDVDVMCRLICHLHIFMHAAIALKEPARLLQRLFYFIADVRTCAINAAIYFIAAFILFYCT